MSNWIVRSVRLPPLDTRGRQTLYSDNTRARPGLSVCRANSRPSLTPDVQRTGSAAPDSAAFNTGRQRFGHSTFVEWHGVRLTS